MPQFRIHNPRNRSDRVLIRMVHTKPTVHTQHLAPVVEAPVVVAEKPKKKKISMRHIQEILKLLQKTKNKDVTKLLTSNLQGLLSQQDDEEVDVDEVEENESEVEIEEVDNEDEMKEGDEDVLIIDL